MTKTERLFIKVRNTHFLYHYILLCTVTIIVMFLVSHVLWNNEVYFNNFSGSDFESYISNIRKIDLVRYVLSPFYILFKVIIIALIVYIGIFLVNYEMEITVLMKLVMVSLSVFLIPDILKILYFLLFDTTFSSDDLSNFETLSLLSVTGREGVSEYYIPILKSLNLYQISFIFVLSSLVQMELKSTFDKSLGLILSTYGTGFVFYLIIMTFLGVNFG